MPTYKILAKRETLYEFEIEANSEEEASLIMDNLQMTEDVENYAYDWYPLEIDEIEEIA